ncbi:Bug family tripartite tricarboxylate transporter substrate binding protein [Ottowia thiooxydans]|uniref:Tripartite-type tricarboxylate transporter receptor subunit TctC n=1 Tax=Ottowia thiooxydans TaxID=219182 RepID=A0ABV2Q9A2_9BURK
MKHLLVRSIASLALGLACATPALSQQAFPSSPINLVVPYPAGGGADAFARLVGKRVGEKLNQPVLIHNRAGASGNIGALSVVRSKPDGYTLFFGTGVALSVNPHLFKDLAFDPQKDFEPIVHAAFLPSYLVVNPSVPANTVSELVTYLKSQNGKMNYASAGNGTPSHLGSELFKRSAKVDMAHIPYKGGAPALTDLMAGRVSMMFAYMSEVQAFLDSGQLRAIGITTRERSPLAPQMPTLHETGLKGYELIGFYGILAPKGTPKARIDVLNRAFNEALSDPDIRVRLSAIGVDLRGGRPEALTQLMRTESQKWGAIIREAGITND